MSGKMRSLGWLILLILVGGCVHDSLVAPDGPGTYPIPGCTSNDTVCFESNVLPIFVSACAIAGCHDAKSHKEGYRLDSSAYIVNKGVQPGNANGSKLYDVLFGSGEERMPPNTPLTS